MRVVVLGCGTGVGKTRVSCALLRALVTKGVPALGLKPIESGVEEAVPGAGAPVGSDAAALAAAGSVQTRLQHPLYALRKPVSPHLAARTTGTHIDLARISAWIHESERLVATHVASPSAFFTVIEAAGGVFSPLGGSSTNFDLARAVEPAVWVLVAADALGVLHDVTATLMAMRAAGREPDHVVLSGAREPDESTGSNAAELATLGIVRPTAVLTRHDDSGVSALVDRLLAPTSGATERALGPR